MHLSIENLYTGERKTETHSFQSVTTGRAEIEEVDPFERRVNFDEVEVPMTPEEAMREAGRCLRCDHYGCGSMVGGSL